MAEQKHAELIRSVCLGRDTRLLTFRAETELGFRGGQYIIVDTGIPLPGNKIAKRAYSILSADNMQSEFQLAVRRIGDGPGSNFMHGLDPGAELTFSGPWGKLVANDLHGDSLVFATDTGVTAALGLLNSHALTALHQRPRFIWIAESGRYFLPFDHVIAQLARIGVRNLVVKEAPPIAVPARVTKALDLIDELLAAKMPRSAYLSGDGAIICPLRDRLLSTGVNSDNIRLECFFNNPERKAPV
jgi:ferredoxin-NADP reductase